MAKVEFEGFVNEAVGNPVFVLKVAENHRKKDDGGNFVNDGKTFFQVKAGYESGIDLSRFPVDSRVRVIGKQRTKEREYNGKKYYDLVVAADSIEVVQAAQGGSNAGSQPQWANTPPAAQAGAQGGFGAGFEDSSDQNPF